jgi:hypothetical protein
VEVEQWLTVITSGIWMTLSFFWGSRWVTARRDLTRLQIEHEQLMFQVQHLEDLMMTSRVKNGGTLNTGMGVRVKNVTFTPKDGTPVDLPGVAHTQVGKGKRKRVS